MLSFRLHLSCALIALSIFEYVYLGMSLNCSSVAGLPLRKFSFTHPTQQLGSSFTVPIRFLRRHQKGIKSVCDGCFCHAGLGAYSSHQH